MKIRFALFLRRIADKLDPRECSSEFALDHLPIFEKGFHAAIYAFEIVHAKNLRKPIEQVFPFDSYGKKRRAA